MYTVYPLKDILPLRSAGSGAVSDASADPLSQVVAAAGLAAAADHFLPSYVVCGRRAYASSSFLLWGCSLAPCLLKKMTAGFFVVDPQLVEVAALAQATKSWQSRCKPGDRATAVTHRRWTAHCYHGCHGSAGCVAVCHTCQHLCQHLRHFSSDTFHYTGWFIPGSLYWLNQVFFHCSIESHSTCFLVGGFNPSEKY